MGSSFYLLCSLLQLTVLFDLKYASNSFDVIFVSIIMFAFDWLNIKMNLKQNSNVRLNLIDRMMQNKLTNNLFGSINLALTTIYMLTNSE